MAKTKTNSVDAVSVKKSSKDVKALKKAAAAAPVAVVKADKVKCFFMICQCNRMSRMDLYCAFI
jgi:hypothetical protein